MKKIFTTFLMVGFVLTAQASFTLTQTIEDENGETTEVAITQDTTIIVSDYEEDFFSGAMVMSVKGAIEVSNTPATLSVRITRNNTELVDEFCLGGCFTSNGEVTQELTMPLFSNYNLWFTHLYPTEPSVTKIAYTFYNEEDAITLTVKYCYEMVDAVENVVAPNQMEGIYNLLGQKMPTDDINDLPAGIYVVNGKKVIKQ